MLSRIGVVLLTGLLVESALAGTLYEDLLLHDPGLKHSLWLEYTNGLENSQDLYAELDLVIASTNHLLLGGGKSDLQTTDGRVNLYSFKIGYNSAYGAPFEYGVVYDYWGKSNELWTHNLSVPLRWNTNDWGFGLKPLLTRINLYALPSDGSPRQLEHTNSQAIEGAIEYYGFGNWDFKINGGYYHYDTDLSRFDNPVASSLFSDVTLVLSYGFPESRLGLGAAYNFKSWRLGGRWEGTVSAVDNSRIDITSLNTAIYLSKSFMLDLEGGRVIVENDVSYNFVKLAGQVLF